MRVVASLPSQLYTTMRNVKRNVLLGFSFLGGTYVTIYKSILPNVRSGKVPFMNAAACPPSTLARLLLPLLLVPNDPSAERLWDTGAAPSPDAPP
mgnify:CR=1 FL=1